VAADVRPEHCEDQVGEAVDHRRVPVESLRAVDHAEDPQPTRDAVQVAKLALQAAENRESDLARDLVCLLERHLRADLAERTRERAVRVLRRVAGDDGTVATHVGERKRQLDTARRLHRRRQGEAEFSQSRCDA
jgi:hypothetical protein